jgi:hypothetical protein
MLDTNSGGQTMVVPSYSVKWHFPSSQEKRGDDRLNQARDLIASEVRTVVTESDLKVIEDKITL